MDNTDIFKIMKNHLLGFKRVNFTIKLPESSATTTSEVISATTSSFLIYSVVLAAFPLVLYKKRKA